mgnify:CR=1 FL=1
MTDILAQIKELQAHINSENDNLLKAIAALAATRQMAVIPRPDSLVDKPTIILPQHMYDRMLKLFEKETDHGCTRPYP